MKIESSEFEPVFLMRIGTEKKFADDYSFEFGGEIYHVNRQLKEHGGLLLFKILDAFNAERKKVEKLEPMMSAMRNQTVLEERLKMTTMKNNVAAEVEEKKSNRPDLRSSAERLYQR